MNDRDLVLIDAALEAGAKLEEFSTPTVARYPDGRMGAPYRGLLRGMIGHSLASTEADQFLASTSAVGPLWTLAGHFEEVTE